MSSLQRLLEYCEKMLNTANKAADNAETEQAMQLKMGAVLAYSSVIAKIREEMKNEDSSRD